MPQTIQPFQGSDSEAGVGEFGTDPAADKQWYGCKPNPLVTVVMQTGRPLSLSLTACPCEVAAIFICRHIQRPKMSIFRKKNGFVLCYSCPDYDKCDELGPDAAATWTVEARSRRNMRTNGRE